ncbi:MAG: NosD domain-containing protein [Candidatus Bathyarchaeales archaeon]
MNIIKENTITNSTHAGIDVSDNSPGNLLIGNTVANNEIGIKIIGSNNSYFYHNSFINNLNNHPWDELFPSVNFWNNSFGEGNYWSNYTGIDANRDGIGDTPHVLYAGNQDHHPLMSPYISGDANHDGIVNIKDVNLVGIAWNTTKSMPKYNPHADLNMDTVISMADADILRKNWQKQHY